MRFMLFIVFIFLVLAAGVALVFGFYKNNFAIFLLGAGIVFFIGLMLLNEGMVYEAAKTVTSTDGITTTISAVEETVKTSQSLNTIAQVFFYGGILLIAMCLLIPFAQFANKLRSG